MGSQLCEERIIMAVDEYETIRLIDLAGYTQEECAAQMGIARTTVQGIYNDARRKLADALVNGKMLFIEGGDIDICERENAGCGRKCGQLCRKEIIRSTRSSSRQSASIMSWQHRAVNST